MRAHVSLLKCGLMFHVLVLYDSLVTTNSLYQRQGQNMGLVGWDVDVGMRHVILCEIVGMLSVRALLMEHMVFQECYVVSYTLYNVTKMHLICIQWDVVRIARKWHGNALFEQTLWFGHGVSPC
jgi:hypothetical protein